MHLFTLQTSFCQVKNKKKKKQIRHLQRVLIFFSSFWKQRYKINWKNCNQNRS